MATSGDRDDERFIALESKLAYQEKLLAELNEVLVEHSRILTELQKRAKDSESALRDALEVRPPNERPPHY
ncbi:MAG TPA: SlyX family protein [Polyangiaceae bacterium]|nr:SlyX family protein [Polyangiaceae bacterium]